MRVLHLGAGNLFGGIETLLLTLARLRALCPEMHPEFGVCFEGRLSKELRSLGVPVHNIGTVRFSRPWTVWLARRRLRRLIAERKYDVVVTHGCWVHALNAPTAIRAKVPVVFWTHDIPSLSSRFDRRAARYPPVRAIANSGFTADKMGILFPGVPIQVVNHPVATDPGKRCRREEIRQSLDTSTDSIVIVMTSRLEPWKGHRLLLQGLAGLKADRRWVCWIAGGIQRPHEEIYLNEMQKLENDLGLSARIRWLGQRNDIPDLLAAADIHCQPNLGPEPFGIVFIEAMYAGLPVVTTRLGAPPESIDATCGILVEPENTKALSEALAKLLDDEMLRVQLGMGGPPRAAAVCGPERQLHSLMAMLTFDAG